MKPKKTKWMYAYFPKQVTFMSPCVDKEGNYLGSTKMTILKGTLCKIQGVCNETKR